MMELKDVYEDLTTICKDWFKHMFFSVTFVKKNGEVREMLCKLKCENWDGKPTHNGGSLNWNPTEKGYLHVIDCKIGKWRCVNFQTIQKIRFGKKDYHFNNFNHFLHFMMVIDNLHKLDELRDEGELEEFNPTTFKSVMGKNVDDDSDDFDDKHYTTNYVEGKIIGDC